MTKTPSLTPIKKRLEEFERAFEYPKKNDDPFCVVEDAFKQFLKNALLSQRKELRRIVEGKKKKIETFKGTTKGTVYELHTEDGHMGELEFPTHDYITYNQALQDILKELDGKEGVK